MGNGSASPSKATLLRALHEAYAGPAWHGPSVLAALRGVDVAVAERTPDAGRNTIWDLTLHLAYARHRTHVRLARLQGQETSRFPRRLRQSWFPELPGERTADAWARDRALLDEYHERLVEAVAACPANTLRRTRPGGDRSIGAELLGMALHDAYHAGQIRLLR